MSEDNEDRGPVSPEAARDQAREFLGVFAGLDFDLGGGHTWHLPNPNYLPPKMKKRHLEYLRFVNNDLDTKKVTGVDPVTDKKFERTIGVWPLAYKGELIDEDELLCIALMGEDGKDAGVADREAYFKDGTVPDTYERFLNAGGVPGQVQVHWRVMSLQMEERVKRDTKSR